MKVGRSFLWAAGASAAIGAAVAVAMDVGRFPEEPEAGGFGDPQRLVIHEWGTFTSLQDEQGAAIGGINADDEPAPEFVHRVADFLVLGPDAVAPILRKGVARSHPDATMRLETPVMYFYPPQGSTAPLSVNIEVAFPGGWLTEYYPQAEAEAPGVIGATKFGRITRETVGRLRWKNLAVGVEGGGPETASEVWLAPRRVPAAMVRTENGETERYLFYRGLGRVESPVRVSRDASGEQLSLTARFAGETAGPAAEVAVPRMWLVHIREDRTCAFRELDGFRAPSDGVDHAVGTTSASFGESEFAAANIDALNESMRTSLVEDGLYGPEAEALLATWKLSYFESPGLRLFYLLPRAWIDRALPLTASVDAEVVRTMVGRVEIVTPHERQLLEEIAEAPASDAKWLQTNPISCAMPAPPANFLAYQRLGRFRNALVLDEAQQRPSAALDEFIANYGLQGYPVNDPAPLSAGGE